MAYEGIVPKKLKTDWVPCLGQTGPLSLQPDIAEENEPSKRDKCHAAFTGGKDRG